MSLPDKKKTSNEFLADLRSIVNAVLASESVDDVAEAVIAKLIEQWGGQPVYILKNVYVNAELTERNQRIYQEFNGRNRHYICRKYGLSEVQLYKIIKRLHEENQADLFGECNEN